MRTNIDKVGRVFAHKNKHYSVPADNRKSPIIFVLSMEFMSVEARIKRIFAK